MARILIKQAIKQNVSDKVPEGAGVHTHTQCVAVTEFSMPEAKARERDRERTGVKPQAVVRRDV